MEIDTLRQALEWSTVLHYSVATIWFIAYRRHRRWYGGLIERLFGLSKAEVAEQVFLLLGLYKIGILLFFFIPSIALRIVS
ncbi:MAG: DUF6868 family protein [Prochlorococcaceae cyanobacterium]